MKALILVFALLLFANILPRISEKKVVIQEEYPIVKLNNKWVAKKDNFYHFNILKDNNKTPMKTDTYNTVIKNSNDARMIIYKTIIVRPDRTLTEEEKKDIMMGKEIKDIISSKGMNIELYLPIGKERKA